MSGLPIVRDQLMLYPVQCETRIQNTSYIASYRRTKILPLFHILTNRGKSTHYIFPFSIFVGYKDRNYSRPIVRDTDLHPFFVTQSK